ncbi:polysaccharide lyase family 14 protein [Ramaria rubella]|nr:polysaccharide lyase family 14 protein [Ramaria rubella]
MIATQAQYIFPIPVKSGWTTSTGVVGVPDITNFDLSDSELGVHRVSSGTTHEVSTLSDGVSKAWVAVYRKGSYKPSGEIKGGFGFYVKGPEGEWRNKLPDSSEIVVAYAVRFQEDFDFIKGGKLPGIFGGEGDKAFKCTGGRKEDRCSCFDLRLMWRPDGQGELYAYLPISESNTRRLLAVPRSHQNVDFGFSVGRGSFKFQPGEWTTVAERVKLNRPGRDDGEIELWVDGVSVIKATGLILRETERSTFQGLHFQTFFGGSTPDWASPKDQCALFANVSGGLIE